MYTYSMDKQMPPAKYEHRKTIISLVSIFLAFYTYKLLSSITWDKFINFGSDWGSVMLYGLFGFLLLIVSFLSIFLYMRILQKLQHKKWSSWIILIIFVLGTLHLVQILGVGSKMYPSHLELTDDHGSKIENGHVGDVFTFSLIPDGTDTTYKRNIKLPFVLELPDGSLVEDQATIETSAGNCNTRFFITSCKPEKITYFYEGGEPWPGYKFRQTGTHTLSSSNPNVRSVTFEVTRN